MVENILQEYCGKKTVTSKQPFDLIMGHEEKVCRVLQLLRESLA